MLLLNDDEGKNTMYCNDSLTLYQLSYPTILIDSQNFKDLNLSRYSKAFIDHFYHVAKKMSNNSLKSASSHRFGLIRDVGLIQDDSFIY